MKKTLILCFIHGFKGTEETFASFPEYLSVIVSHGLPNIDVRAIVYPKYETRGDLAQCVSKFREWLLEKVIDIEVDSGTFSPTVDPSVRVVLIGHSMGGIVATDTVLALASDLAVDPSSTQNDAQSNAFNTLMFPYIQGVIAFDTPYLGISPSVVTNFSPSASLLARMSDALWGSKITVSQTPTNGSRREDISASSLINPSLWQRWTLIATIAGAGAALIAGGATGYMNKETITQGWSWVASHLEFVGCLINGRDLLKRNSSIITLNKELGFGFGNFYTRLGKGANKKKDTEDSNFYGSTRTFCILPKTEDINFWHEALNDFAADETNAHIGMFYPRENPGYYTMAQKAKNLILDWTNNEWYLTNPDVRHSREFLSLKTLK